jgi:hypothetical protein
VTDQSEIHWCQFPSYLLQKKKDIRVQYSCPAGQSFVRNWIDHRAVWHLTAFHYQIVIRYVWPEHCSVCVTHHHDYAYTHGGSVYPTVLEKAPKYKDVASSYENVMMNVNRVVRNYRSQLISALK